MMNRILMNRSMTGHRKFTAKFFALALIAGLAAALPAAGDEKADSAKPADKDRRYDLVLIGGTVHPGDGSEGFVGHVAIQDGRIAAVSKDDKPAGEIELDCTGLVIAPGFIDLHNHSDQPILRKDTRLNANFLLQGCTTIVTGNCGGGHVDVEKYFKSLEADGAGTHVAHLLPQGSLRRAVMGSARRDATEEELDKMRELADKAMRDGAFGMSTGLIYVPGTFTPTEELIEIAKVVGCYGGIYASHIRNESGQLLKSIEEALQIGREADLPVHISHFKAMGRLNWGSLRLAIERIEEERAAGFTVTADQYPYEASSTSMEATLFPAWSREGGSAALRRRLRDDETAERIRRELKTKLVASSRLKLVTCPYNREWVGRSLQDVARDEEIDIVELAVKIQLGGGAAVINFAISEDDMRLAMPVPWVATASDGSSKVPSADLPHPRSFGTFPRKIGHYSLGEGVLPLAQAIRSCSSLPAEILGLSDRGRIEPELAADIAIFDPEAFIDGATFDSPYLPPAGIRHVLVAGKLAVYEGRPTGILAGTPLRKPVAREETAAVR